MNNQHDIIEPATNEVDKFSQGWHGRIELVYENSTRATQVIHSKGQAPLKVQRPFYPEGSQVCHSVILHTAGGIVGGDRLSQRIHLKPHSHALITTTSAAKIYRSNGKIAKQTIDIQVDNGACLEWLPQETILFNGAIYQQDIRIKLAPEASLLLWEITRFGRSARGERFLKGTWRSHTEIWQQGRPLWIDRQQLIGGEDRLDSPHGLAGQPIVATLAWIGQPVTPAIVQQARSVWDGEPQTPPYLRGDRYPRIGEAGVTRLTEGLLCRYRGSSTTEVRNWFTEIWQILRLSYLGRPICPPRVWPI